MHKLLNNLTGKVFGRITVLSYAGVRKWNCKCACGRLRTVRGDHLRAGITQGCGCTKRKSFEHHLWWLAKRRAARKGLPFTITPADIVVPARCPLLDVPLELGTRSLYTASLDRIKPALGYVPGNVWVISWRANQIKSDLTLAQLEAFVGRLRVVAKP